VLFIAIPKRNLSRRRMRTALTCIGVALGVASFIALVGLSRGVERAWTTGLNERGTHVLGMRRGAAEILTATLDEGLGEKISMVKGVLAVSGELMDLSQLDTGSTVLLTGWPDHSNLWNTLDIGTGGKPIKLDNGEVIVGQSIAAAMGYKLGQELGISGREYRIRAFSKSKGTLNNNTIVMRLDDLQATMGKSGRVTVFNLMLKQIDDQDHVAEVIKQLNNAFEGLIFQETSEVAYNNKILTLFTDIAWGMSSIALLICTFVVINTLMMSITERKREIGIYCALGWKPARIILMIGIEAIIMTMLGGIAGCIIGGFGLHWLVCTTELRSYIETSLDARLIFETLLASVLLGTVASLYPAWRATQVNPTEALRYE